MYKQMYKSIIEIAKAENRQKNTGIYYESHHIVPEFMFKKRKRTGPAGHIDGDSNAVDNLVLLTFQEHLMAHYYLYEIYKETHYGYSTGSALQFFFIKATGNHIRQLKLSEVDKQFLDRMAHLRQIGINSISAARKGKMPVVDAITREKIGSISIHHPRVLSGEWVHHSKGVLQTWPARSQKGSHNNNYKELTNDRKHRLFKCVAESCQDGYLKLHILLKNMKKEFVEFKKISLVWICNNFDSYVDLVQETNKILNLTVKYDPYHRSQLQRKISADNASKHRWYNNSITNIRVIDVKEFCKNNPEYVLGKIKHDQD